MSVAGNGNAKAGSVASIKRKVAPKVRNRPSSYDCETCGEQVQSGIGLQTPSLSHGKSQVFPWSHLRRAKTLIV